MLRTVARRVLCKHAEQYLAPSFSGERVASLRFSSGGSRVIDLLTDADFEKYLNKPADDRLAVVDFTATWCPPCKTIEPVYKDLSKTYSNVNFYKADINNEEIHKSLVENDITAVPFFAFFKAGSRVAHFTGADVSFLKDHLERLS